MIAWDMSTLACITRQTLGGNQYSSIFLLVDSHFLIAMLHPDKKPVTVITMLCKVCARAGYVPKVVSCDKAGEYMSDMTAEFP